MEDLENLQSREDDLTIWDRFKNLSNKKIALSDTGKATLATAISAPVLLEGMAHLGNVGLGISAAATILSFLHGDKAIQAGRWVKGKIIEDNGLQPQSDEGETLSLKERFLEINGLRPQSEGRSFEETSFQGIARDLSPMQHSSSEHPENEMLRLGEDKKKRRFDPWVNDLFGKGMIASAVQGSGKSMLCGLIIEQTAKCGVPVIIFDHKGEYTGIAELPFTNGLRAGSEILRSKIGNNCFELSVDNADDFVQLVMSERHQAIVHLPSYGDGWVDRAEIVAAVGQALMRYASKQREAGNDLLPCLVFMDEAQLYIPQNPSLLPPEAQRSKDVLDSLNNAYFALVSNGRSNGYTVCFATQSLTYIAKWAIKSCQIRVLMRHTEKNDLDMCEQIINPSVATREEIEAFPAGTGVVFGFTPKPVVVKFDKRQSKDFSETPGIERLRQPKVIRDIDTEELTIVARVPDNAPKQVKIGTDINTKRDVFISKERFDMLVAMRKSGLLTGYRQITRIITITEQHAKNLNKLLLQELGEAVSECESERECE